ncbi:uncharacterized protein MELLADRAFT_86121 [Melampsora larici-populina 98AG31]|uniref:Zn(2)-C6 fungal-type domain-containing protein n=1 Tax=Melampsora larici-populina (strain 98AG31 / pathotype 3-4-7) TaxID=747676 RepID=F4SDL0_MELLP|nr:uncharacterized protein MELLADRAFT_86121 [Melampsora larici-populina 98AG31]EGF97268.1 hypothetical protein MELLADRAFT_86121 [Melampsora larici-populina 98AG31]
MVITTPPSVASPCVQCRMVHSSCLYQINPACQRCHNLGIICSYPAAPSTNISPVPGSPAYNFPPTNTPNTPIRVNFLNPYNINQHNTPSAPDSPNPSITSSIETNFTTSDPFFEKLYEHNLAWKLDYITYQNWHSWRILDDTIRQFKEAGYEVPNITNNHYHLLRAHSIAEYVSRKGEDENLTVSTFIPFINHAERANAAILSPYNTPSTNPPNTELPIINNDPPVIPSVNSPYTDYNYSEYTPTIYELPSWLDPRLYPSSPS